MRLSEFESRAADMWTRIPDVYRAGVEALVVEPDAVPHPELPGIFTLGECVTDYWPSAFSEEGGDVRSRVFLYHGSFHEVSRRDPAFDWHEEIWETLLHELLHHREFAAAEGGLEDYDWAMDENFKRYAGRPFDPAFYRAVPADSDGVVRIESESFLECTLPPGRREARFKWRERRFSIRVPDVEDVLYVNPRNLAEGRLWVVVRRERSWWRRVLDGLSGRGIGDAGVRHFQRHALPVPTDRPGDTA